MENKNVCPQCGGESFTASAREYHTWKVDYQGNFLSDLGCYDSEKPYNITCDNCDYCIKE